MPAAPPTVGWRHSRECAPSFASDAGRAKLARGHPAHSGTRRRALGAQGLPAATAVVRFVDGRMPHECATGARGHSRRGACASGVTRLGTSHEGARVSFLPTSSATQRAAALPVLGDARSLMSTHGLLPLHWALWCRSSITVG